MKEKLWIKRVEISDSNFFKPGAGGSPPKVFGTVTTKVRERIAGEVRSAAKSMSALLTHIPDAAAIARVVLKDEALAKSHRPSDFFEGAGCPVVGVGGFGELLISVRSKAIGTLEHAILSRDSNAAIANISTIKKIESFSLGDDTLSMVADAIRKREPTSLKLRLFQHQDATIDAALERALFELLRASEISFKRLTYARGLSIFSLSNVHPDQVREIGRFVGTQSLGAFPQYHVVRPASQPVARLTPALFPPPNENVEYPIVGVIDSGVDPTNLLLSPWIAGREEYVPVDQRNYEHGTFVAGLIVHSRTLNHDDPRFPLSPCKILDVVAFPASEHLSEDDLLAILQEVVPQHPEVRIWNLSLGGSTPCSDNAFSDLAVALDELQTTHNVMFVLASGNYTAKPFRTWPPAGAIGDADRICGPADSLRALTVGSVAHRDSPSSRVRASEPSPFTRRGPAPVHLPKPEVTHYGGNCEAAGGHAQMGVLSVDARGNLAESIGTSFAVPNVAAILAHVQTAPREPLSNLMTKALLIHSAVLKNGDLAAADFPYRGFGVPTDAADIFTCDPWSATLLFETELVSGVDLERAPFAMPPCLRLPTGAFRGELTVTLAYEPPLDAGFGAEYCRSNVDLSLGVQKSDAAGKLAQSRQVEPFPKRSASVAEEKKLIEHGFKWSPVKVYRRKISKGVQGDVWRLTLAATDRSGSSRRRIPVAAVVTISDVEHMQPVYNDVVAEMNRLGWAHNDVALKIAPRVRLTKRST